METPTILCGFVWWGEKVTEPPLCLLINSEHLRGGAPSTHGLFMTSGLIWVWQQHMRVLTPICKWGDGGSGSEVDAGDPSGFQGTSLAITVLQGAGQAGLAAGFLKAQ